MTDLSLVDNQNAPQVRSIRHISVTETAKLIRVQLKRTFPKTKFSVRSSSYAGGASISINWTDGPTARMVEAITNPFQGAGFDGMIDMKYYVDAYLTKDGRAVFAQTRGTEGSMGTVPADKSFMPEPDCERVSFGADYVHTSRKHTERLVRAALAHHRAKWGDDEANQITVKVNDDGTAYASADSWEIERSFSKRLHKTIIA